MPRRKRVKTHTAWDGNMASATMSAAVMRGRVGGADAADAADAAATLPRTGLVHFAWMPYEVSEAEAEEAGAEVTASASSGVAITVDVSAPILSLTQVVTIAAGKIPRADADADADEGGGGGGGKIQALAIALDRSGSMSSCIGGIGKATAQAVRARMQDSPELSTTLLCFNHMSLTRFDKCSGQACTDWSLYIDDIACGSLRITSGGSTAIETAGVCPLLKVLADKGILLDSEKFVDMEKSSPYLAWKSTDMNIQDIVRRGFVRDPSVDRLDLVILTDGHNYPIENQPCAEARAALANVLRRVCTTVLCVGCGHNVDLTTAQSYATDVVNVADPAQVAGVLKEKLKTRTATIEITFPGTALAPIRRDVPVDVNNCYPAISIVCASPHSADPVLGNSKDASALDVKATIDGVPIILGDGVNCAPSGRVPDLDVLLPQVIAPFAEDIIKQIKREFFAIIKPSHETIQTFIKRAQEVTGYISRWMIIATTQRRYLRASGRGPTSRFSREEFLAAVQRQCNLAITAMKATTMGGHGDRLRAQNLVCAPVALDLSAGRRRAVADLSASGGAQRVKFPAPIGDDLRARLVDASFELDLGEPSSVFTNAFTGEWLSVAEQYGLMWCEDEHRWVIDPACPAMDVSPVGAVFSARALKDPAHVEARAIGGVMPTHDIHVLVEMGLAVSPDALAAIRASWGMFRGPGGFTKIFDESTMNYAVIPRTLVGSGKSGDPTTTSRAALYAFSDVTEIPTGPALIRLMITFVIERLGDSRSTREVLTLVPAIVQALSERRATLGAFMLTSVQEATTGAAVFTQNVKEGPRAAPMFFFGSLCAGNPDQFMWNMFMSMLRRAYTSMCYNKKRNPLWWLYALLVGASGPPPLITDAPTVTSLLDAEYGMPTVTLPAAVVVDDALSSSGLCSSSTTAHEILKATGAWRMMSDDAAVAPASDATASNATASNATADDATVVYDRPFDAGFLDALFDEQCRDMLKAACILRAIANDSVDPSTMSALVEWCASTFNPHMGIVQQATVDDACAAAVALLPSSMMELVKTVATSALSDEKALFVFRALLLRVYFQYDDSTADVDVDADAETWTVTFEVFESLLESDVAETFVTEVRKRVVDRMAVFDAKARALRRERAKNAKGDLVAAFAILELLTADMPPEELAVALTTTRYPALNTMLHVFRSMETRCHTQCRRIRGQVIHHADCGTIQDRRCRHASGRIRRRRDRHRDQREMMDRMVAFPKAVPLNLFMFGRLPDGATFVGKFNPCLIGLGRLYCETHETSKTPRGVRTTTYNVQNLKKPVWPMAMQRMCRAAMLYFEQPLHVVPDASYPSGYRFADSPLAPASDPASECSVA